MDESLHGVQRMKAKRETANQEVVLEIAVRQGGKVKRKREIPITWPDRICSAFGRKSVRLRTYVDSEAQGAPMIVIEGNKRAMTFVGLLCLSAAEMKSDSSFWLCPKSAGKFHFHGKSTHGISLVRTDVKNRSKSKSRAR